MPKFNVSVEKRMYATGSVSVTARDADGAIRKVRTLIDQGKLQTTSVEWNEPQYEDSSFDATGDVD